MHSKKDLILFILIESIRLNFSLTTYPGIKSSSTLMFIRNDVYLYFLFGQS